MPLLQNYIAGAWCDAIASETLETRDPAIGEPIARVPLSGAQDVAAAVAAARDALPAWRATSPMVRARALMAVRERRVAHQQEIAEPVTRDMGKTLPDAFRRDPARRREPRARRA